LTFLKRPLAVLRPWKASYPGALRLKRDDPVTVIKSDPESSGWLWCQGPAGGEAWVPESFIALTVKDRGAVPAEALGAGCMRRSYDSTELTAGEGESLIFLEEEAGWIWAEDSSGRRGWIPKSCLR
jgi:hypothetical protein